MNVRLPAVFESLVLGKTALEKRLVGQDIEVILGCFRDIMPYPQIHQWYHCDSRRPMVAPLFCAKNAAQDAFMRHPFLI